MASTSTSASFGSLAASTQERAGAFSVPNTSVYTSLNAAKCTIWKEAGCLQYCITAQLRLLLKHGLQIFKRLASLLFLIPPSTELHGFWNKEGNWPGINHFAVRRTLWYGPIAAGACSVAMITFHDVTPKLLVLFWFKFTDKLVNRPDGWSNCSDTCVVVSFSSNTPLSNKQRMMALLRLLREIVSSCSTSFIAAIKCLLNHIVCTLLKVSLTSVWRRYVGINVLTFQGMGRMIHVDTQHANQLFLWTS